VSGIAGIVAWRDPEQERRSLDAMLAAAPYRGQDGSGEWREGGVALGHLATWTTPESVQERQPLVHGDLVLVADARIDNRTDLLRLLDPGSNCGEGVPTDADLILAAYRRWGVDCAAKLVGDFAFAIWDGAERRLFAARDPMGMRALYYSAEPARILFATEIRQILAVPNIPVEIFEPAVAGYLAGGLTSPEWTFYAGILQLPAAHALVATENVHRTWRYWDIDPEHRIRYRTDAQYEEHFRDVFREAVRARLRSVRPVGVLLSGGLDSGSIASMAGSILAREPGVSVPEFRAYCWAFDSLPDCDERHVSRIIAEQYGFPVTDIPVDDGWPLSGHDRYGPHQDDPYFSVQQLMYERTFAAARQLGTRAMMSGDRGDEQVGMWVYDFPGLAGRLRLREFMAELREVMAHHRTSTSRALRNNLLKPLLHDLGVQFRKPTHRQPWISAECARRNPVVHALLPWPTAPMRHHARQQRYGLVFRFGGVRTATWLGRSAASSGITMADPWADRRITEFVLAVPQEKVNRITEPKRLARRALAPVFPPAALRAVEKRIPSSLWDLGFREKERATMLSLLEAPQAGARGFLDTGTLRRDYLEYLRTGNTRHDWWWAVTLEIWLRKYWSQTA
jgi:asparagine synthase (glutamine-hydrolysing)